MNNNCKQTEIGLIPDDWQRVSLETTVDSIDYGLSQSIPKNQPENGYKIVSTADINKEGKILYEKIRKVETTHKKAKRLLLKDGDVLFNWRNSQELIGKTSVFRSQLEPHIFASFILRLRCNNEIIHNVFLSFMLNYFRYEGIFIKLSRRAVNQANFNKNEIGILSITLPPLPEQKKIAQILSKIQQAIEIQESIIKTTQELKKALMQKLFTEGLNREPQKQTEIGPIPQSWEVKEIKDILSEELKNGAFIKNPEYGEGFKFVNVVDVYESAVLDIDKLPRINVSFEEIERYLLKENDIVFVRSSLKREGVGESCTISKPDEPLFFDCHLIKISPNTRKIDASFLVHYFRSPKGKEELIKRSKTTTMTTINQKNLSASLLPYPDLESQIKISRVINKMDFKIVHQEILRNKYSELFKNALNSLMTGKIRVNEIEFEEIEKKKETKIIPIQTKTATPEFKRTVLAAEIVSQSLDDPLFNKTKFQKILYLAEYTGELELVSNYHRDAAGPYDNQMMRSIEQQFKKLKWYGSKKVGHEIKYFSLEKAGGHLKYFNNYWGEQMQSINKLIELLKPFSYDRCEIVATLFAVWNDLILAKQKIDNDTIVAGFYNWHPNKKKYTKERLVKAMKWMRENNLIPKGFGKTTDKIQTK